jgi:lysozyme
VNPITNLADQLRRDESFRQYPYRDIIGKLTIGVGRCLDDCGVTWDEANYLLANDIKAATKQLSLTFPWTDALDEIRRAALTNIVFNCGIHGLGTFRDALSKLQQGQYAESAAAFLDSEWAKEVGARAQRLAKQIETGEWQ